MKTEELIRHVARELRINESQFRPWATELEKAGMLNGDDIENTVTLLLAASVGDGPEGIAKRVKDYAGMHVAQADTNVWEGPARTKEPATEFLRQGLEADRDLDFLNATLATGLERCLRAEVNRTPNLPVVSATVSRDRDLALLEADLMQGATGMLLYRAIPKSVFESRENIHTPEYLDGLETTATINGESLKALATIIRAQTNQTAEAA